jgi:hypothetical protein
VRVGSAGCSRISAMGGDRSSIEVLGPGIEVEADRTEDRVIRLSLSVTVILKNVGISAEDRMRMNFIYENPIYTL